MQSTKNVRTTTSARRLQSTLTSIALLQAKHGTYWVQSQEANTLLEGYIYPQLVEMKSRYPP